MIEQTAPDPAPLRALVDGLTYKRNWDFRIADALNRGQGSEGTTLVITIVTPNSYNHEQLRSVAHYMPIPPAAFNGGSWQRWLLDQILLVEQHEACEFFTIDGEKPYAPNHGPGNNPYTINDLSTDEQRRTSFRGDVKP